MYNKKILVCLAYIINALSNYYGSIIRNVFQNKPRDNDHTSPVEKRF